MKHPIESLRWVPATSLRANDYNPNMVLSPELRLLEHNLVKHGWIQPVLYGRDGDIIDGFHRVQLAMTSKALLARDGGLVPAVQLDLGRPEAMLLTVRMNRAKGVHAATRMSGLVRELVETHGYTVPQVQEGIGATRDEVELLLQTGVFRAKGIESYRYSSAWVPRETRSAGAEGGQGEGAS